MRKLLLSLVLSFAALTTAAHADTFDFYGTAQGGLVGTGTITTNTAGSVIGGTVNFSGNEAVSWSSIGTFDFYYGDSFHGYTYVNLYNAYTDEDLDLYVKDTLVGAKTDQVCVDELCSYKDFIYGGGEPYLATKYARSDNASNLLTSGILTLQKPTVIDIPTAATPEPSSLILLGTGALGKAGALRRRYLARA